MKKIVCTAVSFIVALWLSGCSDITSSQEKSKFDVMVDVLNTMNAMGEGEAGYSRSDRSVSRAIQSRDVIPIPSETIQIEQGFEVEISGSINTDNPNEWISEISMVATLNNYTSDGYTLNGMFNEQLYYYNAMEWRTNYRII